MILYHASPRPAGKPGRNEGQMSNEKRTAATIAAISHHHMPDLADYPVEEGMTLRQALAALRDAGRDNFGDIGGMTAMLSDCTTLEVVNQPAIGGGELMGTQVIRREIDNRVSTLAW